MKNFKKDYFILILSILTFCVGVYFVYTDRVKFEREMKKQNIIRDSLLNEINNFKT